MYTYDPTSIVVTFGSIRLIGFMDGTFVSAERDEDGYLKMVSSMGDAVRTRNGNRGGGVRVTLQQNSPTNDLLFAQARMDEIDGSGSGILQIQDLAGTTILHATWVWVKKFPTVEYGDKLLGRTWVFDCDELSFYNSTSPASSDALDTTHAYVQLDDFEIDGVMSEDHTFDAEITEHPVETGSDIADNVRSKPGVVTLTDCLVSDSPIGDIANRRPDQSLPSADARAKLEQLRINREPITIVTGLKTYQNMVLQSYAVTKTAKETSALRFRCTFKEVIIVTNDRAIIRVAVPSAATKVNLGAQSTKPLSAQDAQKPKPSWLKQAQTGFSNFINRDSNLDAIDAVNSQPSQ